MLHRYRRFWIFIVAIMLTTPLVVTLIPFDENSISTEELRTLASPPRFPQRSSDWQRLPGEVEAYLRDHFGLRKELISARKYLRFLTPSSDQVLVGLDGWMFFRGDSLIEQSTGRIVRRPEIAHMADIVAMLHKVLYERGRKLPYRLILLPSIGISFRVGREVGVGLLNTTNC
jgi:hypothetical protein